MKVHDVVQGSEEWLTLRLGIPTASEFHRIVTPTGRFSKQSRGYALRLVTERLLNRTLDSLDNLEWIERGKVMEPDAVRAYEFEMDTETVAIGFATTDDGQIGASPDRLVGENGLLEVKCPAPQTHVGYLLDGFGNDYLPQAQGQLLVTQREWVDRFSYSDEMPPVRVRTYRDEAYIRLLSNALDEFNLMRLSMLEQVRSLGFFAERQRILIAAAAEYDADI